jgi:hypothetical protein
MQNLSCRSRQSKVAHHGHHLHPAEHHESGAYVSQLGTNMCRGENPAAAAGLLDGEHYFSS